MGKILDCLIRKVAEGKVSRKSADKLSSIIEDYKEQIMAGSDVSREFEAAKKAYAAMENILEQRAKQQEIHLDLVSDAMKRFDSGAPIDVVLESFSFPSEGNAYRYGYLGSNASEAIHSTQRVFKGLATDIFKALDPINVAKRGGNEFEKQVLEDLYAASRGIGKRNADKTVQQISDDMINLSTLGGEIFEKFGGNVTLRKDYFLGRDPNVQKIIKAGKDEYIRYSVLAYDLDRIRDATDGIIRTVDDLKSAVGHDYDALASGGLVSLSDAVPKGLRSVIDSRNHHRIFAFKDAASDILWHEKFGGGSLYKKVNSYTDNIGRDVGILQTYGTKPEAFIRSVLRKAAEIDPVKAGKLKDRTYRHFRYNTGQFDKSLDPTISQHLSTYRGLQTAALLGGTFKDAITSDMVLGMMSRKLRGMPVLKTLYRTLKGFVSSGAKEDAEIWARMGWYTDAFIDDAIGLLRASEAEGMSPIVDTAARGVLKYSLLTRVTNRQKGESVRMLSELLAEIKWGKINDDFKKWLLSNGITKDLLELSQKYGMDKVDKWGVNVVNHIKLFESGFEKEAIELGAIFNKMTELTSPTTSARLRSFWSSLERGGRFQQIATSSIKGFTGYSGSFWENHLKPALYQQGLGAKAKWLTYYAIPLTLAGIVSNWLSDLALGKDIKLDTSTVIRGLLRSNMMLMLGDPLLGEGSEDRNFVERLVGPLGDHLNKSVQAASALIKGDKKKAIQKSQQVLERFVPGRNLWYLGLIQSRMVFDQLNRLYDEEAQRRFNRKAHDAASDGAPYWWRPGETSPDRLPSFDKIFDD